MHELPVNSNGAGLLAAFMYYKENEGINSIIMQDNTMRADYTVANMAGLDISIVPSYSNTNMIMDPEQLEDECKHAASTKKSRKSIVLITPIGGYLAPEVIECIKIARKYYFPVVIDAAHSHYTLGEIDFDIAVYSFYATKSIPLGEGGLITTPHNYVKEWINRFLIYDRFDHKLQVGNNFRMDEPKAKVLHYLLNDADVFYSLVVDRAEITKKYKQACDKSKIKYISTPMYNGYKFIILKDIDFGKYNTSLVFDRTLSGSKIEHSCPCTYNTMTEEDIENVCNIIRDNANV